MFDTARDSLIGRITRADPPVGTLALFWLGQAGFVLRGAGTTLLVDPYLVESDDRLVPPAADPADFDFLDGLLATHEHIDHLDLPTWPALAAASPAAHLVAPLPVIDQVIAAGIPAERVTGAEEDKPLIIGEARITPIPARHGMHVGDAYTFGKELSGGLCRYLGYVIELNGVTVYHCGDTITYEGMAERVRALETDLALLPINGRDWQREQRGLVGNLSYREAADLAASAGVDAVVPMHYDMFAGNRENPGTMVDYAQETYPGLTCMVPGRYGGFVYAAGR
jgi:L-ascorbate metabolism protein UlaG (beta-lactamase superfamily)